MQNRRSVFLTRLCALCALFLLSFNEFTGSLPVIPTLTELDVRYNNFSGLIPAALWTPNLIVASMLHNQLTLFEVDPPLPAGANPALAELDASFNSIQQEIADVVKFFAGFQLSILDLSHNQFSGGLPDEYVWGRERKGEADRIK